MRGCEGRQYGWSVMPGGADRDCRGRRWARRPRSSWAILNGATRSFVSPNILRQRRTIFEQGRLQPMQEAPAVVIDGGGPLGCARIIAMQGAVQFGMRAQRELSSVSGGTAASPPLVVVEL